jgi:hypothetical protein
MSLRSDEDCEGTRHSIVSGQLKPNNEACSGTAGRPRRLLPDNDCGRCPKTTIDAASMAPSTRPAGSDWVSNRMPGRSMDEAPSSLREFVGNSF